MDDARTEDGRARALIADGSVRLLCKTQQPEGIPDAGGFRCPERLCCEPLYTAYALKTLARVRREPLSHSHQSKDIEERMAAALGFLRRRQNPDGTLNSYAKGERHSASVTAEAAATLCPLYAEMHEDQRPALREFLLGCGRALIRRPVTETGDRLAAATALLHLHSLFPDPGFVSRAQRYLDEGVALNADGLYPSRSAAEAFQINQALLPLAELTGDEEWHALVRRSLEFLLYQTHENGEAVYQYAANPDTVMPKGKLGGASVWAAMAWKDGDGQFAHMADLPPTGGLLTMEEAIQRSSLERENWSAERDRDALALPRNTSSELRELSRRGEILDSVPIPLGAIPRAPLPSVYHKTYAESRLVRARDGKKSVTLMAMQPNFLTIHNRGVVLEGLRFASAASGWQPLSPSEFESFGEYLYRFRAEDGSGIEFAVTGEVRADSVSLAIEITGSEQIPCQLEMAWRPEGLLETADRRRYELSRTRRAILTDTEFTVTGGADRLTVRGLPPMTQRYFDDAQPWMPYIPLVRVICPFFSPASVRLEFGVG